MVQGSNLELRGGIYQKPILDLFLQLHLAMDYIFFNIWLPSAVIGLIKRINTNEIRKFYKKVNIARIYEGVL